MGREQQVSEINRYNFIKELIERAGQIKQRENPDTERAWGA